MIINYIGKYIASLINRSKPAQSAAIDSSQYCASIDTVMASGLMTRKEAAIYLGVAEQTLAIWKCVNRYNLPVVKIGGRVKYRKEDLDAFIAKRTSPGSVAY